MSQRVQSSSEISLSRRSMIVGALVAGASPVIARAQPAYPTRPIRIIVPYSAGGSIDFAVRTIANRASVLLGQPLVVDARPGAATIVGAEAVAKAPADGYTLLMTTASTTINNAYVYKKLPYDPVNSFAPVSLVSNASVMFCGPANAPYGNMKEFVVWAKVQNRPISFGTWGAGSAAHLFGELLRTRYGLNMQHVPYKVGPQALTDLRGGSLDTAFSSPITAKPLLQANAIKPLAMAGPRRSRGFPELATFGEQGFSGFELASYLAVYAPSGTAKPIIDTLNTAFVAAVKTPDVADRLIDQGQDPVGSTSEELSSTYARDLPRWVALLRSAGVQPE